MKILYSRIIDKEKGQPDRVRLVSTWGLADRDLQFCCSQLEKFHSGDFITLKYENHDMHGMNFDERSKPRTEPVVCLKTIEPTFCSMDDAEETYLSIINCPFCGAKFEYVLKEVKEIMHKFKKVKKNVTEKEYYTEEKVIKS